MSRDFTLKRYREYLEALKNNDYLFLTFSELLELEEQPAKFVLLRHDVDRRPRNALKMAQLEAGMKLKATYYFRTKKCSFDAEIIRRIHEMGHEVGYHYECLSDADGDMTTAHEDFRYNLSTLRNLVPVKTCAMHGAPFKKFDNRDMWREACYYTKLKSEHALLGEVYLAIDYFNIAYINDTGRNWTSGVSNFRDQVRSEIAADFERGEDLLLYLARTPHPKICFQIHPERWDDDYVPWAIQLIKDSLINMAKSALPIFKIKTSAVSNNGNSPKMFRP